MHRGEELLSSVEHCGELSGGVELTCVEVVDDKSVRLAVKIAQASDDLKETRYSITARFKTSPWRIKEVVFK